MFKLEKSNDHFLVIDDCDEAIILIDRDADGSYVECAPGFGPCTFDEWSELSRLITQAFKELEGA